MALIFSFIHRELPLMSPLEMESRQLFQMECGRGTLSSELIAYYSEAGMQYSDDPNKAEVLIEAGAVLSQPDAQLLAEGVSITSMAKVVTSGKEQQPAEDSYSITYPWDLLRFSEQRIKAMTESKLHGEIHELARVDGEIVLGEGSRLLPGVYIEGNVVIGRNCKIGPNCYIRGNTRIGDKCHIGQSVEIKNSIIMNGSNVGHLSYVGDSVLGRKVNFGAGTTTSNLRHDGKNHRSTVNGKLINTGRRKFGTIVGKGVHTGINTSIYPGRKFSPGSTTLPGEVVNKDK